MSNVLYIKLGPKGSFADDCIAQSVIRVGFQEVSHDACLAAVQAAGAGTSDSSHWAALRQQFIDLGSAPQSASMYVGQLKQFYEADGSTTFITFHGGMLFHAHPIGPVYALPDGHRERKSSPWSSTNSKGELLRVDDLSGRITAVQGYRSTICKVPYPAEIRGLIDGVADPAVAAAQVAMDAYCVALLPLVRRLTPQDFELLVGMIFAKSGWQQTTVIGGTQKVTDLSLELPTTRQRAIVQVKSSTSSQELREYVDSKHMSVDPLLMLFFVWHSGDLDEDADLGDRVHLVGPKRLTEMVVDAGLGRWLISRR